MNPQPALESVLRFVARHTGLAVGDRREAAEAGIRRAMTRAGLADPGRYLDLLGRDASALDDLLAELTVGETYFFREPAQFEFLRRTVLPNLRDRGQVVRAWSAGCASGEEAYSLAILFEREGFGGRYELLATDLCQAALDKARRAVYRAWSLRGEAAASALPYLQPEGELYRVADSIRRHVSFCPLNLTRDLSPSDAISGMDLILCRNVLIYFDRETVRRVARGLFEALAPEGWLITASSDPPLADEAPFEVVTTAEGIFYRRGGGPEPRPQATTPQVATPAAWLGLPAASELPLSPVVEDVLPPARPRSPVQARGDLLAEARAALQRGDYVDAAELARTHEDDPALAVVGVRALANLDVHEAEQVCAAAVARHPLTAELTYLHALLLLDLGRSEEAVRALRRVLYLDGTLAVVHFTLGSVLSRLGDAAGARRAYRNAHELSRACAPDEPVPLAEGESAGRLAAASAERLAGADLASGRRP
jgi:chemotaxis protein methyltransferase CheR